MLLNAVQHHTCHANVGFIHHLTVERDGSSTRRCPRVIRLDHSARMSDFGVRGCEDAVRSCELSGMDALLSVEAHRARDAARTLEAWNIRVIGIRSINGAEAIRTRRRDDCMHRRMPTMSRVDSVVLIKRSDARSGHAHRRRVVASAEDERLETTRRLRDLANPDEAGGGFDLRFDSDASREPLPKLDLRQ